MLCPKCGCLMEEESREIEIADGSIVEVERLCPCCEYSETTYED